MTTEEIETSLQGLEKIVSNLNGELDPGDLELLSILESAENSKDFMERIKNVYKKHDYWTTHHELPEDWESCTD